MQKARGSFFKTHFRENLPVYIIVLAVFTAALAAGALSVGKLSQEENSEIVTYLTESFNSLEQNGPAGGALFAAAFVNNLKWAAIVWLSGLCIVGFPFIAAAVGFKGYSLGFTMGYFISQYQMKGFLFCLRAVVVQNLIFIPFLCMLGVVAVSHGIRRFAERKNFEKKRVLLKGYCGWIAVLIVICAVCAGLEMLLGGAKPF